MTTANGMQPMFCGKHTHLFLISDLYRVLTDIAEVHTDIARSSFEKDPCRDRIQLDDLQNKSKKIGYNRSTLDAFRNKSVPAVTFFTMTTYLRHYIPL